MKKIFFYVILCFLSLAVSCSNKSLLTNDNVSDFQNISNIFLSDRHIESIYRDLDTINIILARNFKGEKLPIEEHYDSFIRRNKTVGCISKVLINLNDFNNKYPNSFKEKESEAVISQEYGGKLLRKKYISSNGDSTIILVSVQEYNYNCLIGYYLEGNAYVYSPNLDISKLTREELSVFGFAYAKSTQFDDWFYTAPLG